MTSGCRSSDDDEDLVAAKTRFGSTSNVAASDLDSHRMC